MSEAKHPPLPCPCCGSDRVMEWINHQTAKCLDCGMNGPTKSWNTRAATSLRHELVAALEETTLHLEYAQSGFISGCMSDEVWCKKQNELIAEARVLASIGKKP